MGARIARLIRRFLFRVRFRRFLVQKREEERKRKEREAELERRRLAQIAEEERQRKEQAAAEENERLRIAAQKKQQKQLKLAEAEKEKKAREEAEAKRLAQRRKASVRKRQEQAAAEEQRQSELQRRLTEKKKRDYKRRAILEETEQCARRLANGMIEIAIREGVPLAAAKSKAKIVRRKSMHLSGMQEEADTADVQPVSSKVKTFRNATLARRKSSFTTTVGTVMEDDEEDEVQDDLHPANLVMMVDEPTFYEFPQRLGTRDDLPLGAQVLCRYKNIVPNMETKVPLDPLFESGGRVSQTTMQT